MSALAERDLMTVEGALTADGAAVARRAGGLHRSHRPVGVRVLDDDEIEGLLAALTPLARAVMATGDIPPMTPIGPIAVALDEQASA